MSTFIFVIAAGERSAEEPWIGQCHQYRALSKCPASSINSRCYVETHRFPTYISPLASNGRITCPIGAACMARYGKENLGIMQGTAPVRVEMVPNASHRDTSKHSSKHSSKVGDAYCTPRT